ncbi:MAG TPA: DUF418 domain-containing protein [Gemmatimonadaceae bacterium]|nr:DUF418 domain-containing protein [Gemmatimonadaceae bacterium]
MSLHASPAHIAAPGALAPIDSDDRLHSLDILRGLALAGMILVHFHQRLEKPVTGVEDLIGWGVWIFVENKAWGTFAFLFGVGFAVLLRRLEARGASVVPIYLRRLAALAVFGIAIQVFFGFHVLFEYACWGLVLLLIRRWSTRALLGAAVLAACVRPIVFEAMALYQWWAATPPAPPGPNLWAGAEATAKLANYGHAVAARWALFLATLPHRWRDFLPSSNLTLFILGLLAVRHRVLDEPLRHVRLIVAFTTFGALSWALSWTVLRTLPDVPIPEADWPVKFGFGLVQDQWLTLTYVGVVVLLLAFRPAWISRLQLVGSAGRMALTNYMLQAALFDVLGSAFGFGLEVRPYTYILLAPAMFAAQALLSRAWLARYRFGPLEWLWRCITYWKIQPLRRERIAPAAGVVSAV